MGRAALDAAWPVLCGRGNALADSLLAALGYPLEPLTAWALDVLPPVPRAAVAQARLVKAWPDPHHPLHVVHLHLRHPIPFRRVCEPYYKKMAQVHHLFVLTAEHRQGAIWLAHAHASEDSAAPWRLITLRADRGLARRYLHDLRLPATFPGAPHLVEQQRRVFWQWDKDRWRYRRQARSEAPDLVALYWQDMREYTVLSADETRRLVQLAQSTGDPSAAQTARHQLLLHNQRLVYSIARRYQSQTNLDLLDLVQAGSLGLMRAIEKFDLTLGHQFSTYATIWIRQGVIRTIADTGRLVRLPAHIQALAYRVNKLWDAWWDDFGRDPTPEEMALLWGEWSPADRALLWWCWVHRLEPPHDWDATWRHTVKQARKLLFWFLEPQALPYLSEPPPDDDQAPPLAEIDNIDLLPRLEKLFRTRLNPRQVEVIKLRYGWEGPEHTLEEIGQSKNLTRERIRQIEASALRILRQPACGLTQNEAPAKPATVPPAPPTAGRAIRLAGLVLTAPHIPLAQWLALSPAEQRQWLIAHAARTP